MEKMPLMCLKSNYMFKVPRHVLAPVLFTMPTAFQVEGE